MNTKILKSLNPAIVLAGLLAACSGGDINISAEGPTIPPINPVLPSTSEAITTHGVVSASADVTVNDVRYVTGAAVITVNGQPGTSADLLRGQIVTIEGTINSGGVSGTATRIRYDANLIGQFFRRVGPDLGEGGVVMRCGGELVNRHATAHRNNHLVDQFSPHRSGATPAQDFP